MTDYDIAIFCKNIKKLREMYAISEEEMAKICGVQLFELRQLEQGVLPLNTSVDLAVRLYRHFNISPEKLFKPFFQEQSSFHYS